MSDDVDVLIFESGDAEPGPTWPEVDPIRWLRTRSRIEALGLVRQHGPAAVVLAVAGEPGPREKSQLLGMIGRVLDLDPTIRVIVLGWAAGEEAAADAIGHGAWDVLPSGCPAELLCAVVERACATAFLDRDSRRRARLLNTPTMPGVVGTSPALLAVCRQLERVAPTDASVVLTGESGTGKEVMARALHETSRRRGRFVAINCAAIPETLLEAELFGYERGAFTGAVKQTLGRFELADGGTLFLDEIGDLPLGLQAKLLRFLQERVIERIGGRQEIAVDARLVCATHRDLKELIARGTFREDLYYRLSEIALHLPPLRERHGDAAMLAHHLLGQYLESATTPLRGFTVGALLALDTHPWPGNIRELQNRVKRAVILSDGPRITARDLDLPEPDGAAEDLDLRRQREGLEIALMRRALARCDGNIAAAARLLGISRPTLYDLMRQHGLRP